ncbi:hypothetical protein Cni_G22296 [Canna indica]|uniref:Uncharacterized protein n=1 Tax=Canna indica TaxID=4628 RepID=A0AAQ3KWH5_9LILI|nr:hypothetical protein Cni_G22296 [Canna indica]
MHYGHYLNEIFVNVVVFSLVTVHLFSGSNVAAATLTNQHRPQDAFMIKSASTTRCLHERKSAGCATELLCECAKAIAESTGCTTKHLRECARAIADKDSANIHRLKWMLNKLASPCGDCEQLLQALFCKPTATPTPTATAPPSIVIAEKTRPGRSSSSSRSPALGPPPAMLPPTVQSWRPSRGKPSCTS